MKRRKRCVNCKWFKRTKLVGRGIGVCSKYGLLVKDTLSGCAERNQQQSKEADEHDNK